MDWIPLAQDKRSQGSYKHGNDPLGYEVRRIS
jgi:hypothetical protein